MDWELELRPLRIDDADAVHSWAQLDEVCRYQVWGPNTPSQTRAFVADAAAPRRVAVAASVRSRRSSS